MPKWIILSIILSTCTVGAKAADRRCDNPLLNVAGGNPEMVESVCEAVKTAETLFQRCNVPPLQRPTEIRIVEQLAPGCVAQFHCGEDRIEVLEPSAMEERRNRDGVFGFLPTDVFFQSIIVHELAHAVYDYEQCPFENCIVTNEYIAHALQIMSLEPADQLVIQKNSQTGHAAARDALNATTLYLAPDLFVKNVWTHLSAQPDMCAHIAQVTNGAVYFDRDRH